MMGTEETNFDRGYIKKKLEHGLTRIWQVWFFKISFFTKAINFVKVGLEEFLL